MSKDLIARLRDKARSGQTYGGVTLCEAADALEAKDKRIKELASRVYEQHIAMRASDEHEKLWVAEKDARIAELEAALKDVTVRLVAAISLLERGGKKAAPSNKMFEQMLVDYKNGVERARAAYRGEKE